LQNNNSIINTRQLKSLGVSFLKEMNALIQQDCIKLMLQTLLQNNSILNRTFYS